MLAASAIVAGIRTGSRVAPEGLSAHEQEQVAYGLAHLKVVAFIERHLFEDLDVARVAAAAGYSASEFSRRFTHQQGESVMAYVRGRRLEAAAGRLLADPEARLLELALECGFDSQAAFTRAFTRAFGLAPGRLRGRGAEVPPPRRRRTRTDVPRVERRIEALEELALVGLRWHFTPANYYEMAGLWERIVALRGSRRDESFGVFLQRAPGGVLDFFAATRAWPDAPAELAALTVPAGRWLALRYHLTYGPLLPQMHAVQEAIRDIDDVVCSGRVDYQRYPDNFAVSNRWIDHYLPLAG